MKAIMSQLGVKQSEIEAEEVIIKTKNGDIIIKEPSVSKINFSGQEMFQISGKIEEEISESDIKTVMSQANTNKERAKEALKKADGDIAKAILILKH
ncbi:MAG: nascent polypeptide-associated complex protein [Candidatus Pacearchaeota archaeon]